MSVDEMLQRLAIQVPNFVSAIMWITAAMREALASKASQRKSSGD